MQSTAPTDDLRPQVALIGALVVVALILLYLAHILYIQSLIVVWGGAIIWGSYIYDKKSKRTARRRATERKSQAAETEK